MSVALSPEFVFVILAGASYRLARFVVLDDVPGEWIRGRFAEGSLPHKLVSCFWCIGSWIVLTAFAVAAQYISVPLPAAQALTAAALVGLIGTWETR